MLWVLLFILIFGPPDKCTLFDNDAKKLVKKHVSDKGSQSEILGLIGDYEKQVKELNKANKQLSQKSFNEMIASRETSGEEFKSFFNNFLHSREPIDELAASSGATIRELMKPTEWKIIVEEIALHSEKTEKQRQKNYSKRLKEAQQSGTKVCSIILDGEKSDQANLVLFHFFETINEHQKKVAHINYRENQVLRNQHATASELLQIRQYERKQQEQLFTTYTTTHQQLVTLTTDEEWKQVIKLMTVVL